MNPTPSTLLHPPIEPYAQGYLPVSHGHTLYWETCGNPQGLPVLFLHGGPGAGCSPAHRQFFDPAAYRIVLFDQRGAGRSTPLGSIEHNTTWDLVSDIEALREHLGITQWLVFGGSWGSTLALAYGQSHTERCLGFVLRGIFLCSSEEVQWFLTGMRWFFPQAFADFVAPIPENERADLLSAYEPLMAMSNSPTCGHFKFPQAAQVDYAGSWPWMMRAAASLSL